MKKFLLFFTIIIGVSLSACRLTTDVSRTLNETSSGTTADYDVDDVSYETLFDDSVYKKFEIYFSRENFDKLIDDMEHYNDIYGSYRDNTIQEVDVTYTDGEGNTLQLNEVGFRTKGNVFTRVLPVIKEGDTVIGYQQVAFQLEFNATFDYATGSTSYNALKQRDVFDLEQLNFKNIRDMDSGVVTESIGYDLYREAGVYTSNTSYAMVYFNIEGTMIPYGLYLIQEPIDDVFVERYFGRNLDDSIGDLYKCTWQTYGPATLGSGYSSIALGVSDYNDGYRKTYALKTNENVLHPDFSSFTDFIGLVNDLDVSSYYDSLSQSLDTDAFARALAMGFLVGSADDIRSDANNYYMYFNNGGAYYIPFDEDNALGYGWNPYGDYGISLDITGVELAQSYNVASDYVLVYNLMNDPDFIDLYLGYLDSYTETDGLFNYDSYEAEYLLIKSLYETEIIETSPLGIQLFDPDMRDMPVSSYYSLKISSVRTQLEDLVG